ncbi:MAG: porphobilinogen synthase [Calditrichaeota bacterium]|nr:porphobilinogen synthase [Calditrichota bacterium]
MSFPIERPRRLRSSPALRRLVAETNLSADHLVQPLFVIEKSNFVQPIPSLADQFYYSPDRLVEKVEALARQGIPAVILFGISDRKDAVGSQAWADDGVIQRAVRAVKAGCPQMLVMTDLCLCEYTDHGHCGIIKNGCVDNDETLKLLAQAAVSQAAAGADIIAPSDMMDGRVAAVRQGLDDASFELTPILSYAAKYASAFYEPFRGAAGSTPAFDDRRGYQMNPANRLEALREVRLDLEEGADMVMVKPALPCLDVIYAVKQTFGRVTAAFQVSGEYAMLESAAANGLLDLKRAVCETLIAIRRAGADFIISYWAEQALPWMGEFAS